LKKILLALLCLVAFEARARVIDTVESNIADTVKKDTVKKDTVEQWYKKPGTFIAPEILIGIGTLSFVVKPIRNFDYYIRGRIAISDPNYNSKLADYLQLSPAALVYALNLVGDEGKNRFVDRTALLALSGGILTITDGLKYVAHRTRPYGTDPLSWPSGHTGAAFLAAEFLAQEYSEKSPLYGVLGYTVAATTGVLRLYGRAHWFSDCVQILARLPGYPTM